MLLASLVCELLASQVRVGVLLASLVGVLLAPQVCVLRAPLVRVGVLLASLRLVGPGVLRRASLVRVLRAR